MLLKRHIPLFIVVGVGLLTLFGHFINQENIQNFVDNDSTQWFDIIASFAIFLGALNMLKLQLLKITRKQKNWQYSLLAVFGFAFAVFAGFFFRGANFITLSQVSADAAAPIAQIITEEFELGNSAVIEEKLLAENVEYEIPKIFITESGAEEFMEKLESFKVTMVLGAKPWGAHMQTEGSLFSWMFFNIFNPLSASMFALLAFFVASASYRAFRIRNFEATLLLVAGIILMLGRVPIGELIPWWMVAILIVFGIGALTAPWFKDKRLLVAFILGGILLFVGIGVSMGWNEAPPSALLIPVIQDWIFDYPTTAGSRALMIGIALGIVATSFRIIIGIERSFLGE
ncbi:MAG: hypothetical protein QGF36_04520 [Candidatus Marinimicrobia bacterium]|nr:hypothetical protein [Candidatus Neomarinimicrobiota bacterium]MDP6936677.1 hypothetical protein [Candidatus Neomarinimicrobiota bacterium]